ncbi:hypothetical protein AVEN_163330-1 [Araneus ventricosus]|uniref:Uncharacterized protein n=1 Tax=Araneus ventricosus TaxID=182803 RepID=A0A4Y2F2R7_ARAVE|nr:hypothetical protein AVEN_163330-1 [Araneus ventricosus]
MVESNSHVPSHPNFAAKKTKLGERKRDPSSNACRTDLHPFLEKIMSRQAPKLSVAMSTVSSRVDSSSLCAPFLA